MLNPMQGLSWKISLVKLQAYSYFANDNLWSGSHPTISSSLEIAPNMRHNSLRTQGYGNLTLRDRYLDLRTPALFHIQRTTRKLQDSFWQPIKDLSLMMSLTIRDDKCGASFHPDYDNTWSNLKPQITIGWERQSIALKVLSSEPVSVIDGDCTGLNGNPEFFRFSPAPYCMGNRIWWQRKLTKNWKIFWKRKICISFNT